VRIRILTDNPRGGQRRCRLARRAGRWFCCCSLVVPASVPRQPMVHRPDEQKEKATQKGELAHKTWIKGFAAELNAGQTSKLIAETQAD